MIYIIVVVLIILGIFVFRESRGFNIVEYYIGTDKDIEPFRFVMISDLHDTDVTHDNNKGLLEAVDSLKPDFVILAGDVITSYMQPRYNSDVSFEFLKGLAAKHKVYYGLGNHEQRYMEEPDKFPEKFRKLEDYVRSLGIEFLSDISSRIDDRKIRIYGFNVPIGNYRRVISTYLPENILNERFGRPDENDFNILIAHHPSFFEDYVKFGPDLVLAGHLHGGIVAIPGIGGLISPQLRLFPKYDFGTFTKDKTTMIVSRGIGWHSIPIRIFNKAEIVSVTVGPKRGE